MRSVIALSIVLCSAGTAWAQAGKHPDVDKVRTAYEKAATAGDTAALVALYTPDAVVMPPDMPMARGKAAIEAFQGKMNEMAKVSNVRITSIETQVFGDTAIDVGTYTQTITPSGGQPATDTGKYVVVLKKQSGGAWLLAYEIYNSDQPMMPPAGAPPAR